MRLTYLRRINACLAVLVISTASTGQGLPVPALAAPAMTGTVAVPWPTKASFLAAARNGDFKGLPEMRGDLEESMAPLVASVMQILRNEYGVPPLPADRQCARAAAGEVFRLLTMLTGAATASMSDRPPDFIREPNTRQFADQIRIVVPQLGTGGGWCEVKTLGQLKPHPYGAAFHRLADDFKAETEAWVVADRQRLKQAYAAQLDTDRAAADKQRADKQRTDADQRAVEQKRIDSERARIDGDQKRRQQQDKNRVAG